MTGTSELCCVACHAPLEQEDRFCERCGARLLEDEPSPAADRVEVDLVVAAGVSDRGHVHRRNEDAFEVEVAGDRHAVAVVCDGISSASAGDVAARSAAHAATGVLGEALADPGQDASAATLNAIRAAYGAVAQVAWTTRIDRGMPSCTLVCALWREHEIVVGSVGDSRAYWLDSEGASQLTVDDSWAEEQVADGLMTFEQAFQDSRSHAITHWIGADAPDRPPRLRTLHPDGPGRLLLCTDGLWNYASTPSELGKLIEALPGDASPAAVARSLADTALARGGRDNITVAVIDIP